MKAFTRVDKHALQIFASLVAGLTDRKVTIRIEGTKAYTDGQTVVLPSEGIWELSQFQALCGIACHEIAHVWFDSNAQVEIAQKRWSNAAPKRVQQACNVVLDVADETRFARSMPHSSELFAMAHAHIVKLHRDNGGAFFDCCQGPVSEKSLLVSAILWTRAGPKSCTRKLLRRWSGRVRGFREVTALLTRAKERPRKSAFKAKRTEAEWRKIHGLIDKLIALLDSLYPHRQAADQPSATDTNSTALPGDGNTNDAATTLVDVSDVWAIEVSEVMAALSPTVIGNPTLVLPDRVNWEEIIDGGFGAEALLAPYIPGVELPVALDERCYQAAYPVFRRTLSAHPIGVSNTSQEGHRSGSRLSRPARAYLDGKCFRRWTEQASEESAVAILLDQSASMMETLPEFLGTVAALVDAIATIDGIVAGVWRFGSMVERLRDGRELRLGSNMGGTATHLCLREATNWLASRPEPRRVVVLFTDGAPTDPVEARAETIRSQKIGVRLVVGTLDRCQQACLDCMPGSTVFNLDRNRLLSSFHVALRRLWPSE